MTGWILFAGVAGLLIGVIVGLEIGAYYYAKGLVVMIKNGELIYAKKNECEK
jgi:hypothetical protein